MVRKTRHFQNNVSLRTKPGKYDDAVVGRVDASNYFIKNNRALNSQGKEITTANYQSVTVPAVFSRDEKAICNWAIF